MAEWLWSNGVMIWEFRLISFLLFRTVIEILQSTVPTYKYITLHADDDDSDSRCQ